MQVLRGTRKYPGVAKFGIALEWGSRGLEFESRHSDQKSRKSICSFCFFLLNERFEHINASVRGTLACRRLDGGNTIILLSHRESKMLTNLDTRTTKHTTPIVPLARPQDHHTIPIQQFCQVTIFSLTASIPTSIINM